MNPNKVWLVLSRHNFYDDEETPHVAFATEEEAEEFAESRSKPPYYSVVSVQLCGKGFTE